MSKITVKMNQDTDNGDVQIDIKGECNLNELQATTGYFMGMLAANTDVEVLEKMVEGIKEAKEQQDASNTSS